MRTDTQRRVLIHRWMCVACEVAWSGERTQGACWACGDKGQITSGGNRVDTPRQAS